MEPPVHPKKVRDVQAEEHQERAEERHDHRAKQCMTSAAWMAAR